MDAINDLVTRQLDTDIQNLATMEPGSAERIAMINEINQLYRLRIEQAKTDADILQKKEELEAEKAKEESELKQRKRDSLIGHIVNGVGIVLPLGVGFVFHWVWNKRWLTFEETGTQVSSQGRRIANAADRFCKL